MTKKHLTRRHILNAIRFLRRTAVGVADTDTLIETVEALEHEAIRLGDEERKRKNERTNG